MISSFNSFYITSKQSYLCSIFFLFLILMLCLFGGEIGWMEIFEEKIRNKTFLKCVWLGGEKGK